MVSINAEQQVTNDMRGDFSEIFVYARPVMVEIRRWAIENSRVLAWHVPRLRYPIGIVHVGASIHALVRVLEPKWECNMPNIEP